MFVVLGLWVILAVDSKGTEEGDKLSEKWQEENKKEEHSDTNPN